MRLTKIICTFAVLVLICSGCTKKEYNVGNNTLLVGKGVTVTGVTFYEANNYESLDTFNIIDDSRMTEYNYSVNNIAVKRVMSEVVGNRIKLVTEYNNFLAYDGYNGVTFLTGTIKESLVGFDYEGAVLLDAKTKERADTQEVISHENYNVVIIKQKIFVKVDGEILYYSDNVRPIGEGTLETTDIGLSYIIFK